MNRLLQLSIGGIACCCITFNAFGQTVVDAGGMRDVFYANGGSTLGLEGFSFKVNTRPQSLDATLFNPKIDGKDLNDLFSPKNGYWIYGIDLKLTAVNGILKIDSWPKTDLSFVLNYTGIIPNSKSADNPSIWSCNLRYTPSIAGYKLYDPTLPSNNLSTKNEFTQSVIGTVSYVPGFASWFGVAFSGGYSAANNYTKLPIVTVGQLVSSGAGGQTVVGSGQVVRYGQFARYNTFPLTVLTTFQFTGGGFAEGVFKSW